MTPLGRKYYKVLPKKDYRFTDSKNWWEVVISPNKAYEKNLSIKEIKFEINELEYLKNVKE